MFKKCVEAGTVGLPFEVWKTYMGTYRSETTLQAFRSIYKKGGIVSRISVCRVAKIHNVIEGCVLGRMATKDD